MADRSVSISLRLRIAEFLAGEKKAKAALGDLDRKLAQTSGFAKGFRAKLEAAFKRLPKLELDANSSPAELKLAELRAKLEVLSGKTIGVDVDAGDALAEMVALHAELEGLQENTSFEVRANISQAMAELHAVEQEVRRLALPAEQSGQDAGGAFARAFRARLEAGLQSLPKATIDADSSPAQVKIAELRARMEALSSRRIGIDVDAASALAEMRAVQAELRRIADSGATVDVRADAARALSELAAVDSEVSGLDGRTVNVRVGADVSGALAGIARVAAAIAGLASMPALATLGAGALGLGAAFGAAGAGAVGFAAVAIPSLGRVNEALKQQERAAGGAGGATRSLAQEQAQAAARALQLAEAQDRVKDALQKVKDAQRDVVRAQRDLGTAQRDVSQAIADAATRHADALRRVADAERQLEDAQRDALRAQERVNDARKEAARDLEDLGNRLAGTQLDLRGASLDLVDAQSELNRVMSDKNATQAQRERAQLNYDRAVQRVKELQLALERLRAEQAQADKDGVEGSRKVKDAKDSLADANRRVADAQRKLADAQRDAVRADEESARRIADAQQKVIDAQERLRDAQRKVADAQRDAVRAAQRLRVEQLQAKAALEQAGGAAGGAASKMAELSKKEKELADDIKRFQDRYKEWQRSLQGDVFPAISAGLDLVESQLPRLSPLVKSAGRAFTDLAGDAKKALSEPIFEKLLWDLNTQIPGAITGLGNSFLNVGKGFAGVLDAFLPFVPTIVGGVEEITRKFADWGVGLGESNEFRRFIAWARENAPKVAELAGNIGDAIGHIADASLGLSSAALDLLVAISDKLASLSPGQIQAIAGGVGAVVAAMKLGATVKLGAIVLLADVLSKMSPGQIQAVALAIAGAVVAVKGAQALSGAITMWGTLKGKLDGVGTAATTARGKLSGLSEGIGAGAGVLAFTSALGAIDQQLNGVKQNLSKSTKEMEIFAQTGKLTGSLADQWGDSLGNVVENVETWGEAFGRAGDASESFRDAVSRLANPGPMESIETSFLGVLSAVTLGTRDFDDSAHKLSGLDQTLATMVSNGNAAGAQQAFQRMATEAGKMQVPVDKLKEIFPQYALAMSNTVEPTQSVSSATDTAKQRLDGFNRSLDTFSGRTDHLTALRAMEKGYKDARDAIDAANGKLDFNARMTDAQRDAVIKARDEFGGYLQKVRDGAEAQKALSGKTTDATRTILEQLPKMMDLAGKNREAREQVLKLAEAYGISRQDAIKAAGSAKGLKEALDKLKSKQLKIDMDTKAAEDKLKRLYDWQLKILGASRDLPEGIRAPKTKKKADGGISLNTFAGGGITYFASGTENHVAQIAPAGAMRVWAEPETGGEAYIPLAASKRARSAEILAATAGIMGYQLMPAGRLALIAAADGGLLAGSMPPSLAGLGGLTALDAASRTLGHRLVEVAARVGRAVSGTGPDESPRSPARTSRPQLGDPVYYSGVASGKPQPGPLGGRLAGETEGKGGRGDRPTINIEKYYEAEGGSATKTAEDLNFIGRRY